MAASCFGPATSRVTPHRGPGRPPGRLATSVRPEAQPTVGPAAEAASLAAAGPPAPAGPAAPEPSAADRPAAEAASVPASEAGPLAAAEAEPPAAAGPDSQTGQPTAQPAAGATRRLVVRIRARAAAPAAAAPEAAAAPAVLQRRLRVHAGAGPEGAERWGRGASSSSSSSGASPSWSPDGGGRGAAPRGAPRPERPGGAPRPARRRAPPRRRRTPERTEPRPKAKARARQGLCRAGVVAGAALLAWPGGGSPPLPEYRPPFSAGEALASEALYSETDSLPSPDGAGAARRARARASPGLLLQRASGRWGESRPRCSGDVGIRRFQRWRYMGLRIDSSETTQLRFVLRHACDIHASHFLAQLVDSAKTRRGVLHALRALGEAPNDSHAAPGPAAATAPHPVRRQLAERAGGQRGPGASCGSTAVAWGASGGVAPPDWPGTRNGGILGAPQQLRRRRISDLADASYRTSVAEASLAARAEAKRRREVEDEALAARAAQRVARLLAAASVVAPAQQAAAPVGGGGAAEWLCRARRSGVQLTEEEAVWVGALWEALARHVAEQAEVDEEAAPQEPGVGARRGATGPSAAGSVDRGREHGVSMEGEQLQEFRRQQEEFQRGLFESDDKAEDYERLKQQLAQEQLLRLQSEERLAELQRQQVRQAEDLRRAREHDMASPEVPAEGQAVPLHPRRSARHEAGAVSGPGARVHSVAEGGAPAQPPPQAEVGVVPPAGQPERRGRRAAPAQQARRRARQGRAPPSAGDAPRADAQPAPGAPLGGPGAPRLRGRPPGHRRQQKGAAKSHPTACPNPGQVHGASAAKSRASRRARQSAPSEDRATEEAKRDGRAAWRKCAEALQASEGTKDGQQAFVALRTEPACLPSGGEGELDALADAALEGAGAVAPKRQRSEAPPAAVAP
ncbi:unnamed protein product [Prorocentrum cordatum]|uniref:Uncharacterized protein n=1 Tax=Prorocentrum cordatum TaxID=2364126 RepID=A0ABN9YAA5_9DINO|nr:unnamed protein product [Polarella glacialis]